MWEEQSTVKLGRFNIYSRTSIEFIIESLTGNRSAACAVRFQSVNLEIISENVCKVVNLVANTIMLNNVK